jgi:hypothetical protein
MKLKYISWLNLRVRGGIMGMSILVGGRDEPARTKAKSMAAELRRSAEAGLDR